MNNITISRFDVAELLNDEETINAYLNEALEDGTPDEFIQALDTVARAKKMHNIATKSDSGHARPYHSLQSDKPRFEMLAKALDAVGYRLAVVAK